VIPTDSRDTLLSGPGIRVRPEMMKYILSHCDAGGGESLPVIGFDARTGTPIQTAVFPQSVQASAQWHAAEAR
jgi:hypothetical protein